MRRILIAGAALALVGAAAAHADDRDKKAFGGVAGGLRALRRVLSSAVRSAPSSGALPALPSARKPPSRTTPASM